VVVVVTVVLTQGQALQAKYHTSEIFKTQTAHADCVQQFDRIISACPIRAIEHGIKICDSVYK
jgi:prephenate dehydrogenase